MSAAEWIKLIIMCLVFISSGVGAVWRVSWIVQKNINDIRSESAMNIAKIKAESTREIEQIKTEFSAVAEQIKTDSESKRGRIYSRFDDYKRHIEDNLLPLYARKDLCASMHSNMAETMVKMEKAIESLRTEVSSFKDILINASSRK